MRSKRMIVAVLGGALAFSALRPSPASAQLLGNFMLNQGVGANNDYPPTGSSFVTKVTDSMVPFSKTISANDGTGAYVTASYNISDNGSTATIRISASGSLTANGNQFNEGTNDPHTTFTLLEECDFTVTMEVTGPTSLQLDLFDNNYDEFVGGIGQSFPYLTVTGIAPPGEFDFFESWAPAGFNDPPQPSDESGADLLTLTFTAIPEPSSATLIAIPAAVALGRRCRRGVRT